MRVRIYDLRDLDSRNSGIHVVLGDWPARVTEKRGYSEKRRVLTRDAMPIEIEEAKASTRCMSWRYADPGPLIEDESTLGVPQKELATLAKRLGFNGKRETHEGIDVPA